MCHTCNSEDTAYRCPQCEREFIAEAHRDLACENVRHAARNMSHLTPVFGLASFPSYLEEFAAS